MGRSLDEGLQAVDAIEAAGSLGSYYLLHSARADLLRRLGRHAEATASYSRALHLATNSIERQYLCRRLEHLP